MKQCTICGEQVVSGLVVCGACGKSKTAALEAEVDGLKKFENTILSKDHTHRYTLGGVTGLEEQIETLKFVCAEHSAEIIRLQSHNKEAMELLGLAFKNLPTSCTNCTKQEKCATHTGSHKYCWHWQHADRYEALKAKGETNETV